MIILLPRSLHETDVHFLNRYKQFVSTLRDSNSNEHSQSHAFVLWLHAGCDSICHETLASIFQMERYVLIDGENAHVFGSYSEISDVATSHAHLVRGFSPMTPDMKISSRILSQCRSFVTSEPHGRTSQVRLRATLGPMSSSQLQIFHNAVNEYYGKFTGKTDPTQAYGIAFETKGSDLELGQRHHVVFTVTDSRGKPLSDDDAGCTHVLDLADFLARRAEVVWVEREWDIFHMNRWATGVCQTGSAYNDNLYFAPGNNLTGVGEIVGVADTGIDFSSCYFHDPNHKTPYNTINLKHRKVISYTTYADKYDDTEAHGTHVAGTVAGFSLNNYGDPKRYNGMAYDAKISFFDIGNTGQSSLTIPNNINTAMFAIMYAQGARIMSNSWGSEDNAYSANSLQVDQFMLKHPDALVLFAAGNNGTNADTTNAIYNSVGAPATCKSGISVGAGLNDHQSWLAFGGTDSSFNFNNIADFSSKGPTADGRLKPDLMAPGWWTSSAAGGPTANSVSPVPLNASYHCNLRILRGTSMSTPTVAGHAVLVRQYFLQGFYPSGRPNPKDSFIPSGALLKAMLIHSGQPMQNVLSATADSSSFTTKVTKLLPVTGYPSNEQGYGRIQMDKVLNFAASSTAPISLFVRGAAFNSSKYYVALNRTHSSQSYSFTTGPAPINYQIRVTLVWTDATGSSGTTTSVMLNKLGVSVRQAGTNKVFHPYGAQKLSTNSFASTGSVQVIDILLPSGSTTYIVIVNTTAPLVTSSQSFALVVTGFLVGLNDTNSNANEGSTTSGSTTIPSNIVVVIVVMTVSAFILLLLIASVYRNDKQAKLAFTAEMERRKAALTGESDNISGSAQPRRNSSAPNSRRPSQRRSSSPSRSRRGSRAGSPSSSRSGSRSPSPAVAARRRSSVKDFGVGQNVYDEV